MATSTRSFIVFKDEPEVIATATIDRKENSSATYVLAPPPGPLLVFAPDKENIDPLTGSRVSADQPSGKKRKTALTMKTQPSSPTKRLKPLAEKATKKPAKTRGGSEKKTKRPSTKRASSSARVHREPSLPRVTEETESVDQAVIDSKCKDLTVLPLADISEAHDIPSPKDEVVPARATTTESDSSSKATTPATSEADASRPATPPTSQSDDASSTRATTAAGVFSTPERKRIYSAFTFSSPSPAAKRYASTRGSSVERFSDAAF
ncbi:hypothetical protein BV20DRAFT_951513 [Pilatotrama ljubarskyi]|nr:hypothetical protein BV20DRAFT_951513 [Pilatotrama ljubarskyi]